MSINASWLRMFLRLQKQHGLRGDALIWGVQDVHLSHEEAEAIIGVPPPQDRHYTLTKNQRQWTSDPKRYMSVKDLFQMLGFDSTTTVDAFPNEGPDILWNLAMPITGNRNKFDLVVDIGVLEHICNPFQALENVGNFLKLGGWYTAYTPLIITSLRSCMFCPNPSFYYDILSANGFGNFVSYINWMPEGDQHSDIRTVWLEFRYGDETKLKRDNYFTEFLFLARKRKSVPTFSPILQDFYERYHANAA